MTSKLIDDMIKESEKAYSIDVAKRMLLDNISIEMVCNHTNLSFEEIADIIQELNIEKTNFK